MSDFQGQGHPTDEQWVQYLYDECNRSAAEAMERHARECPACHAELDRWRGVLDRLDTWHVPELSKPAEPLDRASRRSAVGRKRALWVTIATSAAVLLALGFIGGRATTPRVDADVIRAELQESLQQDMRAMLREQHRSQAEAHETAEKSLQQTERALAKAVADLRREREEMVTHLENVSQQLLAGQVAIRHDLDTLSVSAQSEFDRAFTGLGALAAVVHQDSRHKFPNTP